jgi:molybdopterin-guanine dinucleotide biosynthesis protein A
VDRDLSVAILAGGKSSRMGRDKALLPWDGGQLIDRMIAVASAIERSIETLVVGDRPEYHGRGARIVPDLYPGAGPLGGIATALAAASTPRVLALAVDMPLASIDLLNAMAELPSEADIIVPEVREIGAGDGQVRRLQVLHAIYTRICLEPARKRLCQNERQVTAIYGDVTVERLDELWVRRHDRTLRSFVNVNDPGEYERVRLENR